MTQPSEEQVRAWLKQSADEFVMFAQVSRGHGLEDDARRYEGTEHLYRAALALLDAGRKDRERLDWLESRDRAVEVGPWEWSPTYDYPTSLRAAIDQARGP